MAEQMVGNVVNHLGREALPCRTADEPIIAEGAANGFSGVVPPPVSEAAVAHACQREWALHLDDVMIRRTSWRYYETDHLAVATRVADWMAAALHWSPQQTANELERYRRMTATLAATWISPGAPAGD